MSFNISSEAASRPFEANGASRSGTVERGVPTLVCLCGYGMLASDRFCGSCGRAAAPSAPPVAEVRPAREKAGFPGWGIPSIICSLVALVFVPVLFGALGILFGFFAWRENRGVGTVLMIVGGASIVAGIAIAIALYEAGAY